VALPQISLHHRRCVAGWVDSDIERRDGIGLPSGKSSGSDKRARARADNATVSDPEIDQHETAAIVGFGHVAAVMVGEGKRAVLWRAQNGLRKTAGTVGSR
jgi:hypothetical protein